MSPTDFSADPVKSDMDQEFSKNDVVTLLRVTEAMISGLPEEEAAFLRSLAGERVVVSAVYETDVEVTMTDRKSGIIHFLRVTGSDVRHN
jgi:hypothetical protein